LARLKASHLVKAFISLLHPDNHEIIRAAFSAAKATGILDVEFAFVRAGGQQQWLLAKVRFSLTRESARKE